MLNGSRKEGAVVMWDVRSSCSILAYCADSVGRGLYPLRFLRSARFAIMATVLGLSLVATGVINAVPASAAAYSTATVPVGTEPLGVAVDPTTGNVYVANEGSDTVSVISEKTNMVTATIPVGPGPFGVAVDPTTGNVYVTDSGDASVSVISEMTNTVTDTIALS